jgi:hypothetical protein
MRRTTPWDHHVAQFYKVLHDPKIWRHQHAQHVARSATATGICMT